MPIECVVFDLDDTLFLERDYVRSGFDAAGRWASAHLAIDGFAAAAWELFEHGVRGSTFDQALERCGATADANVVRSLVEAYRTHRPAIDLLPDARRAIGSLASVPLAVVTDGPVPSQRAKADALGCTSWTRISVFTGELGEDFGKPHPRGFEEVERTTGVHGAGCVYVADNPAKDFAGPKSLRWRTVRVRRRGSLHEGQPSDRDVDVEMADLSCLTEWLGV
jgi:putative hydrolase of the HAD superfamily